MKLIVILLMVFISDISPEPKNFNIINQSGQPMQLRVWRDGRLVYDLVLHHGDTLDIRLGSGILIQWRFECDRIDHYTDGDKHIGNGWIEALINSSFPHRGFQFEDRKCLENQPTKA